jgi:hypothetical protein
MTVEEFITKYNPCGTWKNRLRRNKTLERSLDNIAKRRDTNDFASMFLVAADYATTGQEVLDGRTFPP